MAKATIWKVKNEMPAGSNTLSNSVNDVPTPPSVASRSVSTANPAYLK